MPNLIDAAADRLRGRWCQGQLSDNRGNVCLMGAVNTVSAATNDRWYAPAALDAIQKVIRDEHGYSTIPAFNDSEHTTEEDVLLVLKKASVLFDSSVAVVAEAFR